MSDPLEMRVGEIVQRLEFPIEAGKIKEFARAINDHSSVYSSAHAAKELGFTAPPAPPTFTTAANFHSEQEFSHVARTLGLDLARLVHGEHSWIYHKPVVAGDVLTGISKFESVSTRKTRAGGVMRRVVIATTYANSAGEAVISESITMVELPPGA